MCFDAQPMGAILTHLRTELANLLPGDSLAFSAPNPDHCIGCYAGDTFELSGKIYRHHSWSSWTRLAQLLGCRMLTPHPATPPLITIRFQKLDPDQSFHKNTEEKYTAESLFARIDKREEPDFLYHYLQALDEVKIASRKRILDLGVSRGDELSLIMHLSDPIPEMVGIDIDESALTHARQVLPDTTFIHHDINRLSELDLGRFDLLITIGTLQSPAIETKPLIMHLVQNHLNPDGALLFGFPNSRWIDGELIPGARAPNYPFSELSLLIKDIHWIKKYLQQHRYRVRIFGQSYLFLVGTRIGLKGE